jgi:hypothetical protein
MNDYTNQYVLGRGKVYFARYLTGTLVAGGALYIGNTPTFEYTASRTDLKHYSSDQGTKELDRVLTIQRDLMAQFTTDNIIAENLALLFEANQTTLNQSAGGSSVTEAFTVIPGLWYQVGVTESNPLGINAVASMSASAVERVPASGTITFSGLPANGDTIDVGGATLTFVNAVTAANQIPIQGNAAGMAVETASVINGNPGYGVRASVSGSVVTVTALVAGTTGNSIVLTQAAGNTAVSGSGTLTGGGAGSSTALTDGQDWNIDLVNGRFQIVNGGLVATGSTVTVTWTADAAVAQVMLTQDQDIFGELRFVADNAAGPNTDYFAPYVRLVAQGNLQLKGDAWQTMTFQAEIMKKGNRSRLYMRQNGVISTVAQ